MKKLLFLSALLLVGCEQQSQSPPADTAVERVPNPPPALTVGDKVSVSISVAWEYSNRAHGIIVRLHESPPSADVLFINHHEAVTYVADLPLSLLTRD